MRDASFKTYLARVVSISQLGDGVIRVVIPGVLGGKPLNVYEQNQSQNTGKPVVGSFIWVRANHDFSQVYYSEGLVHGDFTVTGDLAVAGDLAVEGTVTGSLTATSVSVSGAIDVGAASTFNGTLTADKVIAFNDASTGLGTTGPMGLEAYDQDDAGALSGALYYRTTPNTWGFEDGAGNPIAEFDVDDLVTTMYGTLKLPSGPDVTAAGGGSLHIGQYASTNSILMDSNEIQAFDASGTPSTLVLNLEGGNVQWGKAGSLQVVSTNTLITFNNAQDRRVEIQPTGNSTLELIHDDNSGRPYIAFFNQDASGNLDRKGYIGYPESANNTSSLYINSDQGRVRIQGALGVWLNGDTTIDGTSTLNGTVSGTGVQGNSTPPTANQLIKATSNSQIWAGWINTVSGARTSATVPTRIYASDDQFIRYYTPANLGAAVAGTMFAGQELKVGSLEFANADNLTYDDSTNIFTFSGDGTTRVATGGFRANNGSVSSPAYAFSSDTDTGFYKTQDGEIRLAVNSQFVGHWTTTGVAFQRAYDSTTAGTSSCQVSTTGQLQRFTSARKYKHDFRPIEAERRAELFDKIEGVLYRSLCEGDDPDQWHMGIIADDVYPIFPEVVYVDPNTNEIESLKYDRLTAIYLDEIRDLRRRIAALEAA